jgi:hypothetical protein
MLTVTAASGIGQAAYQRIRGQLDPAGNRLHRQMAAR